MIERALNMANFIIENDATLRQTAKAFNYSKSTVEEDINKRLPYIDSVKYRDVRVILDRHKFESAQRAGIAAGKTYKEVREIQGKRKALAIINMIVDYNISLRQACANLDINHSSGSRYIRKYLKNSNDPKVKKAKEIMDANKMKFSI